ncbi:MAG TPA: nuclear transport factor 2 family protein [Acidimicrobiales bacterium]
MTTAPAGVGWEDEASLRSLSTAYAAAADARDGEGLASLFVDDGALVVPSLPSDLRPVVARRGHDALVQVAEMLRRFDRTFHLVTNHRFAVEGDAASGEVQCVAHHVSLTGDRPGGDSASAGPAGTDTVWFIRYRDRYRRSAAGWRFERRELHLQWVEEHPVALLGAPAGGPDPG